MGVLSIFAGIILLAYPGLSLVALYIIVSIWLLVFGSRPSATAQARARRTPPVSVRGRLGPHAAFSLLG